MLGAGLALAGPAAATDLPIAFADFAYSPRAASLNAGDTATFSGDFARHPLVWSDGSVTNTGPSKTFTFTHPGTYAYYCQVHVNTHDMRGSITVVDQHAASVSFSVSPSPRAGQPVTFTYTGSADPDGALTSWKWDLDGDGAFETTTPSGAATTTYPTARTVTVRMYAIDDSGEPSATAEQAVTVATAGSGGSAVSGGGASGSQDTTAPRATLVKLSGLELTFRASERASATATLRARGKTIATGSAKAKSGAISLRFKLTRAGRSALKPGRRRKVSLTLTLRDASGNRRSLKQIVTVRRP